MRYPEEYVKPIVDAEFKKDEPLSRYSGDYHAKQSPLTCHICQKYFFQKLSLKSHIDFVHRKIRKFYCTRCPKSFLSRINLTRHIRAHYKKRQIPGRLFICYLCEKHFSTKQNCDLHIGSVHKNLKPFYSTLYDSSFPQGESSDYGISVTSSKKYQLLNRIKTKKRQR